MEKFKVFDHNKPSYIIETKFYANGEDYILKSVDEKGHLESVQTITLEADPISVSINGEKHDLKDMIEIYTVLDFIAKSKPGFLGSMSIIAEEQK